MQERTQFQVNMLRTRHLPMVRSQTRPKHQMLVSQLISNNHHSHKIRWHRLIHKLSHR
jgi:hypothetical protein